VKFMTMTGAKWWE